MKLLYQYPENILMKMSPLDIPNKLLRFDRLTYPTKLLRTSVMIAEVSNSSKDPISECWCRPDGVLHYPCFSYGVNADANVILLVNLKELDRDFQEITDNYLMKVVLGD